MADRGYRAIFVTPTNKLLQEFEGDALTINNFVGISLGSTYLAPFGYSDYDVLVFDEIYFSGRNTYWRIKQFVEENEGQTAIIATGDAKQLKPVQELTNTKDHEEYTNDIISGIFEYNINLKICKRLHTQEDRDKLVNIKNYILKTSYQQRRLLKNILLTLIVSHHHLVILLF